MARLNQRPVAQHPPDADHTAEMTIGGRRLRHIRGTWCGETAAGTWRPARWLHRWPDDLLEIVYQLAPHEPEPTIDPGQLELELAN